MALSVQFWRLSGKAIRVVTADAAIDEPASDVPAGARLYRTDTDESREFDGAAWSSVGGSPGGGASATTIEQDLGSVATFRGKFTITDAAITSSKKVLCWQAPGPYTGKGTLADESDMQPVSVISVEPLSGSAVVRWQTPPMIVESPLPTRAPNFGGGTAANSGTNRDVRTTATRIGKVRGNVKFSYMVLA